MSEVESLAVWAKESLSLQGCIVGARRKISILMPLFCSIRSPSTNHPKSMFQLSGVHCRQEEV